MKLDILTLVCVFVIGINPIFASTLGAKSDSEASIRAFAKPALLGMQLSIKRGRQAGKVPSAVARCVAALNTDSFFTVYDALLMRELTASEQQVAEEFYKSSAGIKFAKHGLLQVYLAVGEKAPESLPTFSQAEMKELEGFSKTSAGDKLIVKKVMQSLGAARVVNSRINELLTQCEKSL